MRPALTHDVCISPLPPFLNQQYHLGINVVEIGIPLVIIYLSADLGSVVGGIFSSFLIARGVAVIRARLICMLVFAVCISTIVFAAFATKLWIAVFAIALPLERTRRGQSISGAW